MASQLGAAPTTAKPSLNKTDDSRRSKASSSSQENDAFGIYMGPDTRPPSQMDPSPGSSKDDTSSKYWMIGGYPDIERALVEEHTRNSLGAKGNIAASDEAPKRSATESASSKPAPWSLMSAIRNRRDSNEEADTILPLVRKSLPKRSASEEPEMQSDARREEEVGLSSGKDIHEVLEMIEREEALRNASEEVKVKTMRQRRASAAAAIGFKTGFTKSSRAPERRSTMVATKVLEAKNATPTKETVRTVPPLTAKSAASLTPPTASSAPIMPDIPFSRSDPSVLAPPIVLPPLPTITHTSTTDPVNLVKGSKVRAQSSELDTQILSAEHDVQAERLATLEVAVIILQKESLDLRWMLREEQIAKTAIQDRLTKLEQLILGK
ncbi:hypothetical protein BC830DRAFT_1144702 [Chytriomyces sp. MP71]|nr:hypothetical protein BC830DRAFT_1144702 [Chytriomyces sp. MP71]